jgi:cytochrome P450
LLYNNDLQAMPKLTAFLKESLRMVPPVPTISRILTSSLKVGDVVIPANMNVAISIETLHHHPDVWPEHDVCIIT